MILLVSKLPLVAHWAEINGWPQSWVALNETTHPEGTTLPLIDFNDNRTELQANIEQAK